jgi:adenylate kinase
MRKIVFLAGIHGVGKTTLSKKIVSDTDIKAIAASQLIKASCQEEPDIGNKMVSSVKDNQNHFIDAVNKYIDPNSKYIIDGHFCLINKQKNIEKIPLETFAQLNPIMIVLLYDDINLIYERVINRGQGEISIDTLDSMQNCELEHGFFVAKSLKIPFLLYPAKLGEKNLINTIYSFF